MEVRNGSGNTLEVPARREGQRYIDELVQVSINSDPTADSMCETAYWVCQDANYNVIGLVDSTGTLKERYEYTPYGERMVFFSPGSNDPDLMAPTLMSRRIPFAGGVNQPYGLNEFGHQGLHHDEELGLIYNRARALHPTFGRFMQRDPLGYMDGMSFLEYLGSAPLQHVDPEGKYWENADDPVDGKMGKVYTSPDMSVDGGNNGLSFGFSAWVGKPCCVASVTTVSIARADGTLVGSVDAGTIPMAVTINIPNAYEVKVAWSTCVRINGSSQYVPGCTNVQSCPLRVRATVYRDSGPMLTQTYVRYLSCDRGRWVLHRWKTGGTYVYERPLLARNRWRFDPGVTQRY